MKYNIYEWKINPKSSFMTKLHSDTIWGHIIWAIRYLDGEERLNAILSQFENNNAPFIVSNGFVSGYLPLIKKSIISTKEVRNNLEHNKKLTKQQLILRTRLLEEINKIEFIDIDTFNILRNNKHSVLYQDVLKEKRCPFTFREFEYEAKGSLNMYFKDPEKYKNTYNIVTYNDLVRTESITKNKINRITNSSEQNDGSGVFTVHETFYNSNISIYIKLRDDIDIDILKKYLYYIEQNGFGKKASSGKGSFETISFTQRDDLFINQYGGDGYVVLSNYIPKEDDYKSVIGANLITKRGKVSGIYSQNDNVFKKTFVCFAPGSVFKGTPSPNKGRMLNGLYHDKNVVQYGIPFILGVNINGK